MKFIIIFAALFAIALAEVDIIQRDLDVQPESFKFSVETSDGTKHNAQGQLNDVGSDHEEIAVSGSYSFIADNGQTYTVDYIADKNGFQPKGAHLPVSPEA